MQIAEEKIFSVSELNQEAKHLLQTCFAKVSVLAEISNLARPSSGHLYFTLKDANAQIRCAMFRPKQRGLALDLSDGLQVIATGNVSLYEARGDYQLIVEHIADAGIGALQQAFEQLKQKLLKAGLFAEEHKKPLPTFPKGIAVVTSNTGAAIRDIISVAERRCPLIPLYIYPCSVQGKQATPEIINAIERANQDKLADVILLARGGGSLEDLWCFNDEALAHTIFASELPVISGVGHEVDFTIADFVADVRAPTPSAAAEMLCPDQAQLLLTVKNLQERLVQITLSYLAKWREQVTWLTKSLKSPKQVLQEKSQTIDLLELKLKTAMQHYLQQQKNTLALLRSKLEAYDPDAVLQRGYAMVLTEDGKHVISSCEQLAEHDVVKIRFKDGATSLKPIGNPI